MVNILIKKRKQEWIYYSVMIIRTKSGKKRFFIQNQDQFEEVVLDERRRENLSSFQEKKIGQKYTLSS